MRPIRNIIRYRLNRPTQEMLKGTYVFSPRTGWCVYTGRAMISQGSYVDKRIGPIFDPKRNTYI